MLVHLVFFRFKESAQGRTAEENAILLESQLKALPAKIPEIRSLQAGRNLIEGDGQFHLGLYTTFDDAEALERYRMHPAHQKVIQFILETTEARSAVDFLA
jgi:hypothetical protein